MQWMLFGIVEDSHNGHRAFAIPTPPGGINAGLKEGDVKRMQRAEPLRVGRRYGAMDKSR